MYLPEADMPTLIPVVAAKVSSEPADDPVVLTVTADSDEPGATAKVMVAFAATVAAVLRTTPVDVTLVTVVAAAIPAPRTVMPALMPVVWLRDSAVWPAG